MSILSYAGTELGLQFPDPERLMVHQTEVLLNDPTRFKVLIWHRRARKTTTAITEIVKQAHLRVGIYWHIFPRYGDAKDAVWRDPTMLFSLIPKNYIKKINETELVVYFNNGSVYQLKGSDDPDALRGPNPVGIVFDEYDTQRSEGWAVVEPILRANGGWAWFIGTPRGKKKLFALYNLGQSGHREWKSWLLKASTSGIILPDQLEESKATMSRALYNQEWECEFLEGEGGVFRGVREVAHAEAQKAIEGRLYIIGCDLAKVQDFTVLTVYDRLTNTQVNQDRFQKLEWPFQKARIQAMSKLYNNAVVALDATGIGDPIADDLIRSGVPIEAIKITNQNKKDMIEKLSIWIDQGKISILPIDESLEEFDNFGYEIGEGGRIRYGGQQGYHDDIVMSHALAVSMLYDRPVPIVQKPKTLLQEHYQKKAAGFREYEDPFEDW